MPRNLNEGDSGSRGSPCCLSPDPKQAQAHAYPVHKGERKSLAGKRHKVR